jgi:hypothetical protein
VLKNIIQGRVYAQIAFNSLKTVENISEYGEKKENELTIY